MSTTLKAVRERILSDFPELGSYWTLTSLTTTTAVVSRLATGTVSAQKYINKWLLRPDAASQPADRERLVTNFAASTGTFTHAGTNYADTTATGETLEVLEHPSRLYDEASQKTLRSTSYMDVTVLPGSSAGRRWLTALSWLEGDYSRIARIEVDSSGILSRNRYFTQWGTYNSSGVLVPDNWVIAGASATVALSTTQVEGERGYSAALTRAGTNATLTQTVGVLESGVSGSGGESLRGQRVDIVVRCWASVASRIRGFIYDGTTTTNTSYHTGGSGWEELTINATLATTATNVTFGVELNTGDTTAYISQCYLVKDAINDSQRRDGPWYPGEIFNAMGGQAAELSTLDLPRVVGYRYHIWSQRPYPALTESRFLGGTADADTILAPIDLIATGSIANMFDSLAYQAGVDTSRYRAIAKDYRSRFEAMQKSHLYVPENQTRTQRTLRRFKGPWMAYAGRGLR